MREVFKPTFKHDLGNRIFIILQKLTGVIDTYLIKISREILQGGFFEKLTKPGFAHTHMFGNFAKVYLALEILRNVTKYLFQAIGFRMKGIVRV